MKTTDGFAAWIGFLGIVAVCGISFAAVYFWASLFACLIPLGLCVAFFFVGRWARWSSHITLFGCAGTFICGIGKIIAVYSEYGKLVF